MKKWIGLSIVLLVVGSVAGLAWANKACETPNGDFNIMISPNTLVLSSLADVVTIHSNIPYSMVNAATVVVNGVDVPFTKADACGDLVAKISVGDLAEFLQRNQVVTLTLSGALDGGGSFAVADTVAVKK